jgi:NADPH:quinone reductase-like Zn-dependent oxidoreductase
MSEGALDRRRPLDAGDHRKSPAATCRASRRIVAAHFAEAVLRYTDQRGVDVILDHLGGPYLAQNVRALAVGGRPP